MSGIAFHYLVLALQVYMMACAAVVPSSIPHGSQNTQQRSCGWTCITRCFYTWKQLQVSYYGGKYSIHRLLALDEYTRTTSLSRILLICVSTPMPTFILVLIQDSIPLQDPTKGWRENYGFWIRSAILAFVISFMASDQTRFLIDGIVISWRQLVLLSICTSCMFTICAATVSAHLIFPVPFFALTMAPLFYPLLVLSYRIVVGSRIFQELLNHPDQLFRFIIFVFVQVMTAAVYPAYEMLFHFAQGSRYQVLVIFLLPTMKVVVKSIVLRCMAHMEDMVPEAVIFTVDFFNAIYIATCMQSTTSLIAMVAITITDLSQTAVMLYGLHRRTVNLLPRLHSTVGNDQENDNLVAALCSLCRNPETFKNQIREGVQVNSCFPHRLSRENSALLENLCKVAGTALKHNLEADATASDPNSSAIQTERASAFQRLSSVCLQNRIGIIHQVVPNPAGPTFSPRKKLRSHPFQALARRGRILGEALEVIFSIECLVVTAYVETVVPFLYSCYVVIMVHFPSARYHSDMAGVTNENVGSKVMSLLLFGLLQIFSFALLVIVIKKNCGLRAYFQIAFVLDAQMSLIQGKLVAWVIITLCFRVVHFGTLGC